MTVVTIEGYPDPVDLRSIDDLPRGPFAGGTLNGYPISPEPLEVEPRFDAGDPPVVFGPPRGLGTGAMMITCGFDEIETMREMGSAVVKAAQRYGEPLPDIMGIDRESLWARRDGYQVEVRRTPGIPLDILADHLVTAFRSRGGDPC